MDGWVTIGTKMDTKQLEKDLKNSEKRLQQYEREAERLTKSKAKAEIDLQGYEESKRQIREITNESNIYAQNESDIAKNLQIENTMLEELNNKYSKQLQNLEEVNQKIQENAKNQSLLKTQIEETNVKLGNVNGFSAVKKSIDNIGDSMTKVLKKVGKWALAVFGIRTAYNAVRRAISVLSQHNKQLAIDLEYISYSMASVLQPIIKGMINLVYKLLQYVNYIANAWFGINLFANASSDAFNSANNNANKLKKTLAGFDEMNVLNGDISNANANGLPSFDLSQQLSKQQVPKWLQWIADNKNLIAEVTKDLLILFGAVTIGKILKNISTLFGTPNGMGLLGLKNILAIIGTTFIVKIAVEGVKEAINQIKELNDALDQNIKTTDKTQKNILKVIDAYEKANAEGTITDEKIQLLTTTYDDYIRRLTTTNKQLEEQKTFLGSLTDKNAKLNEQQKINIETLGIIIDHYSQLYEQGKLNETQQKLYKKSLELTIEAFANQGKSVDDLQQKYKILTNQEYKISIKAEANLKEAEKDYSNFFTKLGESFGVVANPTQWGSGFTGKLKKIWSGKKLAVGGIVNMPGRGIMYGGANIAERGPEGVIPLTNSQMMSELGKAIGQYVTINANITNTMNGRVISRELQKVNNNSDFAMNR